MGRKPGRITPYRQPNRSYFVASFRDVFGERLTRGLDTDNETEARSICNGIERLLRDQTKELQQAPSGIHPKALQLYFRRTQLGEVLTSFQETGLDTTAGELHSKALLAIKNMAHPVSLMLQLELTRADLENQKRQCYDFKEQLEQSHAELARLKASVIGNALAKQKAQAPSLDQAAAAFEVYLKGRDLHHTTLSTCLGRIRAFTKSRSAAVRRNPVDQIKPQEIQAFLDNLEGDKLKRLARRREWRTSLGRFFNWCAKIYGFESQMPAVEITSANQVEEERGDIVWHSQEEVQAALDALPDAYWRTLVAVLAYAGLRLSELVWLRTGDLDLQRGTLWVTTVEDQEGGRHKIKTLHARRTVNLHPELLWPLMRDYHAKGLFGEQALFPVPPTDRRIRRKESNPERWRVDTLSNKLRTLLDTPNSGIMPLTLRHTFGSLLLRAGRSVTEVSAAMGNSPEMVLRHYARLLGHEVQVNF